MRGWRVLVAGPPSTEDMQLFIREFPITSSYDNFYLRFVNFDLKQDLIQFQKVAYLCEGGGWQKRPFLKNQKLYNFL